jgi:hypothetical protein
MLHFLYGCETWSLTRTQAEGVREQSANEDGGPNREDLAGEWRKLHKEEVYALYPSPNAIRMIKARRM